MIIPHKAENAEKVMRSRLAKATGARVPNRNGYNPVKVQTL
jgi:hypothetical protein